MTLRLIIFAVGLAARTDALAPSVLAIGCTGGTGLRAFRGLVAGGLPPKSISFLTRDAAKPGAATLARFGATLVVADLDDAASLAHALAENVYDAVYVHGTAGDEKRIDTDEVPRAARLSAALAALETPPLVVYNSAAAPDAFAATIPRITQKRAVEATLVRTLPRVAALRAHLFMEELWKDYTRPSILKKRVYPFSVPTDKTLCLTSVKDMGKVAARCILENVSGELDVVSDALTPAEIAGAFSDAQGEVVRHKQTWLLFFASRILLPELYRIIRFYRSVSFAPYVAARPDLRARFSGLPPLDTFSNFLEETRWADADRDFATLGW